jgi:hypothetical protein
MSLSSQSSDRIPVFVFMIFLDWFEYILLTSSSFRLDPNLDEQNTVQAKSRERFVETGALASYRCETPIPILHPHRYSRVHTVIAFRI